MLGGIGACIGALAVAFAAYLGRSAVKDFRIQRLTEREIEHAENILAVAYELERALDMIRSPFMSGFEQKQSQDELIQSGKLSDLTEEKKDFVVRANVYFVRSRTVVEKFQRAQRLTPYAAVFFGRDVREALEQLIVCRNKVLAYAEAYPWPQSDNHLLDKEISAAIWKGSARDGPDEITELTEAAIKKLEDRLFPVIRPPETKQKLEQK
jgi:hypothetical protein